MGPCCQLQPSSGDPGNHLNYTLNYGSSLGPDHARVTLAYTTFTSKEQAETAVALLQPFLN